MVKQPGASSIVNHLVRIYAIFCETIQSRKGLIKIQNIMHGNDQALLLRGKYLRVSCKSMIFFMFFLEN